MLLHCRDHIADAIAEAPSFNARPNPRDGSPLYADISVPGAVTRQPRWQPELRSRRCFDGCDPVNLGEGKQNRGQNTCWRRISNLSAAILPVIPKGLVNLRVPKKFVILRIPARLSTADSFDRWSHLSICLPGSTKASRRPPFTRRGGLKIGAAQG